MSDESVGKIDVREKDLKDNFKWWLSKNLDQLEGLPPYAVPNFQYAGDHYAGDLNQSLVQFLNCARIQHNLGCGHLTEEAADRFIATVVEENKPKKIKAAWTVRLDTKCPKCGHRFDLFACQDWLLNQRFDIGEYGTLRTTDVEVECPKCGHEFEVTFDEW